MNEKIAAWERQLGKAWIEKEWTAVIALCEQSPVFQIKDPMLLFWSGNAHRFLKQWQPALELLSKYHELKPRHGEACMALGSIYLQMHAPRLAELYYQKAIELGCWQKEVWNNYGTMLYMEKRYEEAEASFRQGLRLWNDDAQCRFGLAQVLLTKGEWGEAWLLWRSRFLHPLYREEISFFSPFINEKKSWEGEIFSGKRLVILQEKGYGDTLWNARYFPLLKERGGWVVLAVKEPLLRLSERFNGVDEIVELNEAVLKKLDFDLYVPCMELPRIFGTTPQSIPHTAGYLKSKRTIFEAANKQEKMKIGLVWHTDDPAPPQSLRSRNIPLPLLQPLLELNAVEWVSLQVGPAAQELQREPYKGKIMDLAKQIHDFEDTAKQMEGLDLIITADTATAHLAGSMGIPAWVLLPWLADSRWMEEEEETSWYRSLKLFRCAKGEWQDVIQRVKQRLEGLLVNQMEIE